MEKTFFEPRLAGNTDYNLSGNDSVCDGVVALNEDMNDTDDEFENLLNSFLDEERDCNNNDSDEDACDDNDDDDDNNDDDSHEDDENFVKQKYAKKECSLPKCGQSVHTCEQILVKKGCGKFRRADGETFVFVWRWDEYTDSYSGYDIDIMLKGFCKSYDSNLPMPVLYIYNGWDMELARTIHGAFDSSRHNYIFKISDIAPDLVCGNFLLVISNLAVRSQNSVFVNAGGNIAIPFMTVYDSFDDLINNPVIDVFRVRYSEECAKLDIDIKTRELVHDYCAYTVKLFNESYNHIAEIDVSPWNGISGRPKKNFKLTLDVEGLLEGEYFFMVSMNGRPVYRYDFVVENGQISELRKSEPGYMSPDYLFMFELEDKRRWCDFRNFPANTPAKRFVMNRYVTDKVNEIRRANELMSFANKKHFVYYGGCRPGEQEMLRAMCRAMAEVSTFRFADCVSLAESKAAVDPYEETTELLDETHYGCLALYNITALVGVGAPVVTKILSSLETHPDFILCLIGSMAEVKQLFESYPRLADYFPRENVISRGGVSVGDYLYAVKYRLRQFDLELSSEAQRKILDALYLAEKNGNMHCCTVDDAYEYTCKYIVDVFVKNMSMARLYNCCDIRERLSVIPPEDVDVKPLTEKRSGEFERSIARLNSMVGLDDVKDSIITAFNRIKINEERKRLGLKVKETECHHMIFTGNPGTGKTTVAKLVGRIYRSLGLLSKGNVICADRGKIVGRYLGETERNMQRLLAEAKGNVLFIDEAYTLCDTSDDRKDFGYRAIECLLTVLAQEASDMIVILAGYDEEMSQMMRCNQGLEGRFPYKFNFKDYSADELMQIAMNLFTAEDYELSGEAEEMLRSTIEECVANKKKNFSNARWIEQYVNNGIKPSQSDRLVRCMQPLSRDDYRRIEVEDVRTAYHNYKPKEEHRRREIGFIA